MQLHRGIQPQSHAIATTLLYTLDISSKCGLARFQRVFGIYNVFAAVEGKHPSTPDLSLARKHMRPLHRYVLEPNGRHDLALLVSFHPKCITSIDMSVSTMTRTCPNQTRGTLGGL